MGACRLTGVIACIVEGRSLVGATYRAFVARLRCFLRFTMSAINSPDNGGRPVSFAELLAVALRSARVWAPALGEGDLDIRLGDVDSATCNLEDCRPGETDLTARGEDHFGDGVPLILSTERAFGDFRFSLFTDFLAGLHEANPRK